MGISKTADKTAEKTAGDTQKATVSRRAFLGLAGLAGMGMIATGASAEEAATTQEATVTQEAATTSRVDPIVPVAPPAEWDEEADVVVVGSGGGLVGAVYAAMQGKRVTVLEKASDWGGSSKETDIFSVMGSQTQAAIYAAIGDQLSAAGDPAAEQLLQLAQAPVETMRQRWYASYLDKPNGGSTGELPDGTEGPRPCKVMEPMLSTLVNCIPDAIDFMGSVGVLWGPVTEFGSVGMVSGLCPQGSETGGIVARANYTVFETLYNKALELGVSFHFDTPAVALVMQDGAVVGVQAEGEVTYVKAADGVILAAGGFTNNQDMLEAYCPHVSRRVANSTVLVSDMGDGIRMGLGAGGQIVGYDSSFVFDGGLDNGQWGHYLYKGDVQIARQPWCTMDIAGNRVPYYPTTTLGFTKQAGIHMQNPDHFSYVVFDSHFDEIIKNWDATGKQQLICRDPITAEKWVAAGANVERFIPGLIDEDYTVGVQEGIDGGWIKKADSLEELAEALGFDTDTFISAVENWNAMCDAGEDALYHLDPAWLTKVQDGPFYGMRVSGTILSTLTGLNVNTNMQVLDAKAQPIPGLYAAGVMAGGFSGDASYGDCRHPGGGVAMSCGTSFQAARCICGELG